MGWWQAAAADVWLRWGAWVAVALAAGSLALMAQVLLLSEVTGRRRLRRRAFERRWRPRLAAASLGDLDVAATRPPAPPDRDWFLAAWCQMQGTLRGAAHARLNALLRTFGLDRHAARLVDHGDLEAQLLGLACLRHLADPADMARAARLARRPGAIRALAAAGVMVAIDPVVAMAELVPLVAARADWTLPRVVGLARAAGPAALTPPLLAALGGALPPGGRDRLLALLPLADPAAALPWARATLAGDPSASERAAAYELLGQSGDPRDRALVAAGLADASPRARVAAVRAMRALGSAGDLPRLEPLLADRDWAVRQAAADTIAALPGLGRDAVVAVAGRVDDRYGRDAILRALEERGA